MKLTDKQKIIILVIALVCNFTFLALAQTQPSCTSAKHSGCQ